MAADFLKPNMLFQDSSSNHEKSIDNSSYAEHQMSVANSTKGILFLFTCFAVGALVRQLLKVFHSHLPYTVVLFVLGVLFGVATSSVPLMKHYTTLSRINAELLTHAFLPILIFESAYSMDAHMFKKSLMQSLVLAGPGLIICMCLTAAYSITVLSIYKWNLLTSFLFGSILSATDPVAVVALMKECGISPTLTTLIEGESLLNDGSAIVIFDVLLEILVGEVEVSTSSIMWQFVKISVGGPVFGYLMGKLCTSWLVSIYKDEVLEFTITLCFAYITYHIAQEMLKVSGVLAVVVLGVVLSAGKSSFSPETEEAVHNFWEMMCYFANTLIFIIVGIIISERAHLHFGTLDIGLAFSTYIFITVARLVMIIVLSPILTRLGYGLSWKNAVALVWGGLRGAVGLALALSLAENPVSYKGKFSDQVLLQTSVVILLTLVVNGTTMQLVLNRLGINKISHSNKVAMGHAVTWLRDVSSKSLKVQKKNKFFGDANWLWVESHTRITNPYHDDDEFDEDCNMVMCSTTDCEKCLTNTDDRPNQWEIMEMEEEARLRLLKSLKMVYWNLFEHCMITRRTVQVLISAANDAIDKPGGFIDAKEIKKKYMTVNAVVQRIRDYIIGILDNMNIDAVTETQKQLSSIYSEVSGFQRYCVRLYMSPNFEIVILASILLNVGPLICECYFGWHSGNIINIIFHILNVAFLLVYIFEAFVKIICLGFLGYLRRHWHKFEFFIILLGAAELCFHIFSEIFKYDRPDYISYIQLVRLVRLLEMKNAISKLTYKLLIAINSVVSSQLYTAYDMGHGFVVAQEEVIEKIDFIVDYKPCRVKALRESELGILEMIKAMNQIQKRHAGVSVGIKSHKASLSILNDVTVALKELREIGLVDETEYEKLLQVIDSLMRAIMSSTRALKPSYSIKDILRRQDWMNTNLLNIFLESHVVKDYNSNQNIINVGDYPQGIFIITSGVVRITGKSVSEKENSLPNTDSLNYFSSKGKIFDFVSSNYCLGIIGYLVKTKYVTSATCETPTRVLFISYNVLKRAEQEMESNCALEYIFWQNISQKIASHILLDQPIFQGIKTELLKVELEKAIIPDLKDAMQFEIDPRIRATVLIQGRARDAEAGKLYFGPDFIPPNVERLFLDDDPEDRPRVIFLLLPEDGYKLPSDLYWPGQDREGRRSTMCFYHSIQHRRSTVGSIIPHSDSLDAAQAEKRWSRPRTSSTRPLTESV